MVRWYFFGFKTIKFGFLVKSSNFTSKYWSNLFLAQSCKFRFWGLMRGFQFPWVHLSTHLPTRAAPDKYSNFNTTGSEIGRITCLLTSNTTQTTIIWLWTLPRHHDTSCPNVLRTRLHIYIYIYISDYKTTYMEEIAHKTDLIIRHTDLTKTASSVNSQKHLVLLISYIAQALALTRSPGLLKWATSLEYSTHNSIQLALYSIYIIISKWVHSRSHISGHGETAPQTSVEELAPHSILIERRTNCEHSYGTKQPSSGTSCPRPLQKLQRSPSSK